MATRVRWVDQVRALAMILIVLGHSLGQTGGEGGTVYNWLCLFHVPLCVVLSGFLFSPRNTLSDTTDHNDELNDYKFLCFDGVPYFCWVDTGRFSHHTRTVYDMDWQRQLWSQVYDPKEVYIEKPQNFEKMRELATILCKGFRHVRVDLARSFCASPKLCMITSTRAELSLVLT